MDGPVLVYSHGITSFLKLLHPNLLLKTWPRYSKWVHCMSSNFSGPFWTAFTKCKCYSWPVANGNRHGNGVAVVLTWPRGRKMVVIRQLCGNKEYFCTDKRWSLEQSIAKQCYFFVFLVNKKYSARNTITACSCRHLRPNISGSLFKEVHKEVATG